MSLGPIVRSWLPRTLERKAAGAYRGVFVDLEKVARRLASELPESGKVLDIGGGDGELLNYLLALRPDISVTMVDVARSVGKFIEPGHLHRVEFVPATTAEQHIGGMETRYDVALVSDVMHHLPLAHRARFLSEVRRGLKPHGVIFVKDIEPGDFISALSLFCDKYISGDRGVSLVSQSDLRKIAEDSFDGFTMCELGLYEVDPPNYLVKMSFSDSVKNGRF